MLAFSTFDPTADDLENEEAHDFPEAENDPVSKTDLIPFIIEAVTAFWKNTPLDAQRAIVNALNKEDQQLVQDILSKGHDASK